MNLKPQMAFISRCIYEQNKPILCAIRTVPCSEWDSGWLFLANNDGEPEAPLMLINVEDVPEIDSSIAGLLNAPYNFTYSKNSPKDRWRVLGNDYESRGFAYRNNKLNAQVAFVCRHIVDDPLPALAAIRSEPAFAGDSGWQLICNCFDETDESNGLKSTAVLCSVEEMVKIAPSIARFIHEPLNTTVVRESSEDSWEIIQTNSSSN